MWNRCNNLLLLYRGKKTHPTHNAIKIIIKMKIKTYLIAKAHTQTHKDVLKIIFFHRQKHQRLLAVLLLVSLVFITISALQSQDKASKSKKITQLLR